MPKLEHLRKALNPDFVTSHDAETLRFSKALDAALSGATKPLERALLAAEKLINDKNNQPESVMLQTVLKSIEETQKALSEVARILPKAMADAMPDYTDIIQTILSEVRAIPTPKDVVIPKAEKVDLSPLLEAIRGIEVSPQVVIPKAEERKTHWTFDVVRNRTTGLIEKIEAR